MRSWLVQRRFPKVLALVLLALVLVDTVDTWCDPLDGRGAGTVLSAPEEAAQDACADTCVPDCFCCSAATPAPASIRLHAVAPCLGAAVQTLVEGQSGIHPATFHPPRA